MRMLLVAPPMRNTAYSISCTGPVRAPTMRSVPLTDCAKLLRMSLRSRSSPSSSAVASAMDSTTSASVPRRFQALRAAQQAVMPAPSAASGFMPRRRRLSAGSDSRSVEARGQPLVVADEDQRAAGRRGTRPAAGP